jgi:hypothetical protein
MPAVANEIAVQRCDGAIRSFFAQAIAEPCHTIANKLAHVGASWRDVIFPPSQALTQPALLNSNVFTGDLFFHGATAGFEYAW